MKFLRNMAGKTKRHKIRNEEIRKMTEMEDLGEVNQQKRLRWFGHVKRMGETRIPKQALDLEIGGKRPRMRWEDKIKEDVKRRTENAAEVYEEEWW